MVCKAHEKRVTPLLTANSGFIGLRIPRHPVALELLHEVQPDGIGAPSANRFGHVSPTRWEHVVDDLGYQEKLIVLDVDSENREYACGIGIESTVAKIESVDNGKRILITILRKGGTSVEQLESALRDYHKDSSVTPVELRITSNRQVKNDTTEGEVAPGQMITHYAPDVQAYMLRLVEDTTLETPPQHDSNDTITRELASMADTVIIDFNQNLKHLSSDCLKYIDLSPEGVIEDARKNIFEILREAEKIEKASVIVLPNLEPYFGKKEHADACQDRLFRAASGMFCVIRENKVWSAK